jgi:hypothetical protein
MFKSVVLVPVLVIFLFSIPSALSENSSNQIVVYCLKADNVREIRDHFSTDEKICAEYTFLPRETETGVEFRWYNPMNKKTKGEFELVRSPIPHEKRTVISWVFLQSRLMDKIVGSRYFGKWRVELWVNNRRITEKAFSVGN